MPLRTLAFSFFAAILAALSPASHADQIRYFMQPSGISGSSTAYGNNAAAGRYVRSDGARIYYETYGSGEPVIVLHGGGVGTPYELGALIDRLRSHYRVTVVSSRGHGRSEIGSGPMSLEQKAADVLAVIRAVTDRPARIIGFSDGGFTALQLASSHPVAVDRIAVIGAGTLARGFFSAGSLKVADIEHLDKAFLDQQRRIMPEPGRLQEFWDAYTEFWSRTEVGKPLLSAISCPVLLIAGDEDDHAPAATVLQAHEWIANSRLCIVPNAWHTAFLDNLPVVWAALEPFVRAGRSSLRPSRKVPANSSFHLSR